MTTDLRAAIEAELQHQRRKAPFTRSSGYESGLEFALRAIDAAPAQGLDVERLAQAIHADAAMGCPPGDECLSPSRHKAFAERIREYGVLAPSQPEPDL